MSSIRDLGYEYVLICPKCGHVGTGIKDEPLPRCLVCKQADMVITDFNLDEFVGSNDHDAMCQRVREQYGLDKLDPQYVWAREKYDKKINKEFAQSSSRPRSTPVVECPYCHSTNTTKITATQKAVNTALFGIFGNKRKYQWHCNSCKSDF